MRPRTVLRDVELFAARTPTLPPATHTNSYALGGRDVLLVEPATPYEDELVAWLGWARGLVSAGRRPLALFVTAASLTEDGVGAVQGMPIAKDPWLVKRPRNADRLTRKERYALPRHYVGDILKASAPARPRSVALFAGSLDLTTMNVFEKLFVLLVIGATPGDGRHFDFIREWAAGLGDTLRA